MKHIENKLTQDAQFYAHEPNVNFHGNVMDAIKGVRIIEKKSIFPRAFNGFLATRITAGVSALIVMTFLIVGFNNESEKPNMRHESNSKSVHQIVSIEFSTLNDDIESLSLAFETNLISGIKVEKQALKKDLEYMKNLFIL